MAYEDFKDLPRRTSSDKLLCNKEFNFAKNPRYDDYQRGFAAFVYKVFDTKFPGSAVKSKIMLNQQLSEELHKPIIMKLEKRNPSFKYNISGAGLADLQLISIYNKRFRFLLCNIDIYNKYAWALALKDKKGVVQLLTLSKNFR